jgi:hypothetical protein
MYVVLDGKLIGTLPLYGLDWFPSVNIVLAIALDDSRIGFAAL